MEAATNHFLPESGCPFFLELVIALYLIYSLGTSVKITNEMATVFPTQNFAGGHFTVVVLLIVLHGLMPSAFSEHLSLNGDVIHGSHTSICQNIVIASSLLAVGVSHNFLKNRDVLHYEYKSLILFSILGLLVLSVSSNLALIYLAIELQSLAFYVLATFGWTSDYSVEAGLKYFVIGSFSSCLLLFGFVLLYINTGSLSFEAMQKVYTEFECFNIVFFSICFSLSALLFKVGAAPFHTWLCDVYEGSLTSVTLFFAVVPKIVLFYLFFKIFFYVLLTQEEVWSAIMLGSGLLSVIIASVGALVQKKVKRLLAFSAVSHTGFLLLAVSCTSIGSVKACTFYLALYIVMNLALFSIIFSATTRTRFSKYLVNWSSQTTRNSLMVLTFSLTLFSIAGIPPLGGFYSKLLVLTSLITEYHAIFTVIVAFFSCIACFYYIRLIKMFFFTTNSTGLWIAQPFRLTEICLAVASALIFFILAHPSFVLTTSNLAAYTIL